MSGFGYIGKRVRKQGGGAATRLMKAVLFGIRPLDGPTFALVPVVLLTAAILASYIPARRATKVDRRRR